MAKTVGVREETWKKLKKLLESAEAKSFDERIRKMIDQRVQVPKSMLAIDRHRKVQLTLLEHGEITRDVD